MQTTTTPSTPPRHQDSGAAAASAQQTGDRRRRCFDRLELGAERITLEETLSRLDDLVVLLDTLQCESGDDTAARMRLASRELGRLKLALHGYAGMDETPAGGPTSPVSEPAEHPDAALLEAWDQWRAGWRASAALPVEGSQEDAESFERMADRVEDVISTTPARTVAGVAVKLRLLFSRDRASREAHEAMISGTPLPKAYLADEWKSRLKWEAL